MEIDNYVVYKNEIFWILNTGKYYCSGQYKNKVNERLLHRRIWSEHYGKIPYDHHIHHVNGDWRDNNIENLECISRIDHQKKHMFERYESQDFREKNKKQLELAQLSAKKWHSSTQGIRWHIENGKKVWEKKESKEYLCIVCNKKFNSKSWSKVFCCSLTCTIYNRNQKAKIKFQSNCRCCGKLFQHGNLIGRSINKGCSRKCSISIKKSNRV